VAFECADATGTRFVLASAARRIVSLVPSETETIAMLGGLDRVVGRTDYCVEPADRVQAIPCVGGTKNARVKDVLALRPDLVLANQEENTESIVTALRAAGAVVFVSFPRTVRAAVDHVAATATLLGLDADEEPVVRSLRRTLADAEKVRAGSISARVFCPIWRDPWMTANGDTFISDLLDLAGGTNVFAERVRRYPLAVDLQGERAASTDEVVTRDTRYPRVSEEEIVRRAPEVVLLPDEPYAFGAADELAVLTMDVPAARNGRVHRVDGKDLCWYSPRMIGAIERLRAVIHAGAPSGTRRSGE